MVMECAKGLFKLVGPIKGLVDFLQILGRKGFDPDKERHASALGGKLQEVGITGQGQAGLAGPFLFEGFEPGEELFCMPAVSCNIVVDKDDKFPIQTLDFTDDFVYRPAAVGISKKMGYMAEITLVGAAPGRLDAVDGHVGFFAKKIEAGLREPFHGAKIACLIKGLEVPPFEIFDQLGPDFFGFADDYGIDVLLCLKGAARGMRPAHHDRNAPLPKPMSDFISPLRMHHHPGDAHQIDLFLEINGLNIFIGDSYFVTRWGKSRQGCQREACKPDVLNHFLRMADEGMLVGRIDQSNLQERVSFLI